MSRSLVFAMLVGCRSSIGAGVAVADDGETFVAVAFDEAEVLAYVCDGTDAGVTTGQWLGGPIDGDAFDLSDGAVQLSGTVADGDVDLVLTVGGADATLTATGVAGDGGLLFGTGEAEDGSTLEAGWIVSDAGDQRGAARVTVGAATTAVGVTALPSDALVGATDQIMVIAVSHEFTTTVSRIVSPRDPSGVVSP